MENKKLTIAELNASMREVMSNNKQAEVKEDDGSTYHEQQIADAELRDWNNLINE